MCRQRKSLAAFAVAAVAVLVIGLATGQAQAARMVRLTDSELDAVYAEGLVIDLRCDIAISDGAQVVTDVGWDQLQDLLANGFEIRSAAGDGSSVIAGALVDPSGSFAVLNPAKAAAMSGSSDISGLSMSGINVDVVNGDVAIGINIAVFVNSVITDSALYQFNFNFSDPGNILDLITQ